MTGKQNAFVIEYLKDLNATQAAIRAGYSVKTAFEMGSENLKKPYIKKAIREQQDSIQKATGVTAEYVIKGFREIADYGLEKFKGKLRDARAANNALENLGKIIGVYAEDNKQKADNLAQFLKGLDG